ncbi:hypothetical protein [Fundidesulfovibrio terrae]|uniref:hypothetical protein n=1 Tax=Fundidesulfovibrio terrae TaxID=2922866 RepID=UPI001FAF4DF7|nr:hypothetical protein [Fundidesulfovibrio terrae]
MKILLVEPKSSTTYPPLGLMKIATYHKLKGDEVSYVIGKDAKSYSQFWDVIYLTTVFTYDLKQAVETINFYSKNLFNFKNLRVGGVAATLMPDFIEKRTGIKPHIGLLNQDDEFLKELANTDKRFFYLKECNPSIDNLPPDYSIFPEDTKYKKIIDNSYFLYATKGCPNKCDFCAVKQLEPESVDYIPIVPRIDYIKDNFGERPNITFLDNNIAASTSYTKIISEIKSTGFEVGATFEYKKSGKTFRKKRAVDFNQGVDARLMDENKMELISGICINPLRLAFDDIKYKDTYTSKVKLAISKGVLDISNYMLFNHRDTPKDLYQRMLINTKIKEEHPEIRIFSFPMRYSPVLKTDRRHVGKFWHRRQIRAFQLILNATHGIVSHKPNFFYRAFGLNLEKFLQLLSMPFRYIINRDLFEFGIPESFIDWELKYTLLSENEKAQLLEVLESGDVNMATNENCRLGTVLEHYKNDSSVVIPKERLPEERELFSKRISQLAV